MEELKPCPFCGGEAYVEKIDTKRDGTIYLPLCKKFNCHAGDDPVALADRAEAVKSWNTRTPTVDVEETSYNEGYAEGLREGRGECSRNAPRLIEKLETRGFYASDTDEDILVIELRGVIEIVRNHFKPSGGGDE